MALKARTGVLILVLAAQFLGPSGFLVQRVARNNDLTSGVHKTTSSNEELKSEIRDFVKHENHDHLRIRNRDRKFYEDEISYFKALMHSPKGQVEQRPEKGKKGGVNRNEFPKTNVKESDNQSRIKRQAIEQNGPHFVMPRSASYSTGYVNLQPNGPFLHHVAVNVPNHPQMQPFPAQAPVASYSPNFPYQSSSGNNNPAPLSLPSYQRSVLPNSREVNLQLLKSENGGMDIERAPRTFGLGRNNPTTFGRANSASNLLGERFQTIDGSSPFGGGLRQNNPVLDSINQNLDRNRIQMLEQQIRIRDDRLRLLEEELMQNCNRRPDIFSGGRQNNFDGFPRMPDFGPLRGRQNTIPQLPMRDLQDFSPPRSGLRRPTFQGRSRGEDQEEDSPQLAAIDEETELGQIQKAEEFDFNRQPTSYNNQQGRGLPGIIQRGRPSIFSPTDSKQTNSPSMAGKSGLLPKEQKNVAGAVENAFQPKSAFGNDETPIPNTVENESGQFVDGQWLPPARQQLRNNEGTPFCVPAPAPASLPRQRNNKDQEITGKTQDLDKDQQKIVLETLEQAVKPLMDSIDALKENNLAVEEPVVSRPIPKLKDLLTPRAMLPPPPPPPMPALRPLQRSGNKDQQPTDSWPKAATPFEPQVPNILLGKGPNDQRPLIDALEKMRSNRKEILQDLADNLKPLERPGLLGLNRPLIPQNVLSSDAFGPSVPQVENNDASQLPVEAAEESVNPAVGLPISKQPFLKKSTFENDPSVAVAAPKSLPAKELSIINEQPQSPISENQGSGFSRSSPRMKADDSEGLDAVPPNTTVPKTNSKPGKISQMMGLDSLRENMPIKETDKLLRKIDESSTASPRENETNSNENFVDMEVTNTPPMARNKETAATEPEQSMCQTIIKEIVTREMEDHADADINPAMFINKNFTTALMKRVNFEVEKYHRDHAVDGQDFKGSCDDADMKLEIVSQVLLMLNKWIQEAPSAVEGGTNSLTAGQITELRNLLDS